MPPRLSGRRVTEVAQGQGGRPKALNPGNAKAANFKPMKAAIAKRQKIGQDRADARTRGEPYAP